MGLSVHDQLQASLDTDHHEVGAMLAKKWKLPEPVVKVLQYHVDDTYDGEHKELVNLIYICSCWVTQYMETEEWNVIPEEAEQAIQKLGFEKEALIKIFKKEHNKISALQSMADALVSD